MGLCEHCDRGVIPREHTERGLAHIVNGLITLCLAAGRVPEFGEEKVLAPIFRGFGVKHGYYVDIGSSGPYSNTEWLQGLGWHGLALDRATNPVHHVTAENVDTLLEGVPVEFPFLSVDVDGMDYWILKAILRTRRPLVICVEFNQNKMAEDDIQPYDPAYVWLGGGGNGCSWRALNALVEPLTYMLCFKNLVNVIFVRNIADTIRAVLPRG